MCMGQSVKKEKESFKKLCEGIQNDVVKERIKTSGEWYIENAAKYKRWFFVLSIVGVVAPVLATIISSSGLNIGADKEVGGVNMRILAMAVCSALASLASTFMVVTKCKEKWTNYRSTVEQIKSELVFYAVDEGEEREKLKRFVKKVEKVMQEEHGRWNEILKMQNIDETDDTIGKTE